MPASKSLRQSRYIAKRVREMRALGIGGRAAERAARRELRRMTAAELRAALPRRRTRKELNQRRIIFVVSTLLDVPVRVVAPLIRALHLWRASSW